MIKKYIITYFVLAVILVIVFVHYVDGKKIFKKDLDNSDKMEDDEEWK